MSYVIYHKNTTIIVRIIRNGGYQDARFETLRAARAGLTRLEKRSVLYVGECDIAELGEFHSKIEKTETRTGVGPSAGKTFVVPVNTPWTSGPWSETFWCS